ncbi:MAG: putative lipid II flippase FtsW [Gammaproteobacteria bacterium]|nr:putative lipid II flippase FtsW [Gammaproteobacteria bacterium]
MTAHRRNQATLGKGQLVLPGLDYWVVFAASALLGLGLIMVGSATFHRLGDAPFFYFNRHLIALFLGICGALLVFFTPVKYWQKSGAALFVLGLVLLCLVVFTDLGREANGATRWIPIGAFNLQSSEFMKLFLVVYFAGYLVRRKEEVATSVWGFMKPMILLMLASGLIMLQPDFGTTAVLLVTAMGMLFLGGVPLWQFGILVSLAGSVMVGLVYSSPYRLQRVTTFLDPWADVEGSGYQLAQALIAFGRGEWLGVGLGSGIQKQFYLPEAHTDFLMAVIGEELGLAGTLAVILLFAFIVARAFSMAAEAERSGNRFSAYVAQGLGLWLGMQAFINIGVNVGLLPTKGLTLPLMSYGGNSIIVACTVIGMLVRIDYENRSGSLLERREVKWAQA